MPDHAVARRHDIEPIDLDALNPPKVVPGTVVAVRGTIATPTRATRAHPDNSGLGVALAFMALLFWFGVTLSVIYGVGL